MKNYYTQRGSATALAIGAMMFLGIVIAGLLPMLSQEMKAAALDKDMLQAQYAAEAGAKRAVQALDQKLTATNVWTNWLGSERILDAATNASYTVTLNPTIDATHALDTAGTYTITSIGRSGNLTKTVTVTYKYTASSSTGPEILWGGSDDPRYQNTREWATLSNGDMIVYNGNQVTNSVTGKLIGTTASKSGFDWGLPVTTSVTNVYLDLLEASFFTPSNPRFSSFTRSTMNATMNPNIIYGSSWGNLWGPITLPSGKTMYEVSGDVIINTPLKTSASSDQVLIYSHGNIIINDELQGNFAFVAEGYLQLHGNKRDYGQQEFYSMGNMDINQSVEGYGVFMTRGGLHITDSYYVKAFMYGRNNAIIDVNGKIQGAIYSNGYIKLNAKTNLTYDATAIPK